MSSASLQATIRELLGPTIERQGFDLVAVELLGGARRPVLRLSIDKPGGVDAQDCARITHRVGPLLDEADPMPGAYDLEVSSPGIDRPVQRLADFARFVGFRVRLRLEEGLPRRRYTGRIARVDGDTVEVEVDGEVHPIAFDTIDAAHLVLDLDEYQSLAEAPPSAHNPMTDGAEASDGDAVVPSDRTESDP